MSESKEPITFRTLRKRKNKKLKEMATELEISESSYTKYETSARTPQGKTLTSMKKIYECTDEELMEALNYNIENKIR